MPATATDLRAEIIALIEATFQDDTPPAEPTFDEIHSGRLPRLIGSDGAYAGVYPHGQAPRAGQMNDQETKIVVQFYLQYAKTRPIDPKYVADPAAIESVVETFQEAVQDAIGGGTQTRWFYNIAGVDYPPDPTGQVTRAEVTLVAHGSNPAILETV